MAHLAPGGYFAFQLLVAAVFLTWLVSPSSIQDLFASTTPTSDPQVTSLDLDSAAIITAVLFAFGVMSYFIGVVLRLPSVNEPDDIAIDVGLRETIDGLSGRRYHPANLLRNYVVRHFLPKRALTRLAAAQELSAGRYLAKSDTEQFKHISDILAVLRTHGGERSQLFSDWIRDHAASFIEVDLRKFIESAGKTKPIWSASRAEPAEGAWLSHWLWRADRFPFPFWLTHKSLTQVSASRFNDYVEHIWPLLWDTLRGHVSTNRDLSIEPFNRCKLFVLGESERLATEIGHREALVRMMVGFRRGLILGLYLSVSVLLVSIILFLYKLVNVYLPFRELPHHANWVKFCLFAPVLGFAFNSYFLFDIDRNFHKQRSSEAETVFDAYITAMKKVSQESQPAIKAGKYQVTDVRTIAASVAK